jgi:[ribosomal protein S18]-alanine N-acetyltransferase
VTSGPARGLSVARMQDVDLEAVAELCAITRTNVDLAAERGKDYSQIWVARRDDRAIAYALVWIVADELQLVDLATHVQARRQGAALALIQGLIAHARKHALRCLVLEVRTTNQAALALYRKLGFTEIRVRPRYYSDGESACEMELSLSA